jgi:hypothetical protein
VELTRPADVRYGSLADIAAALLNVRFTPKTATARRLKAGSKATDIQTKAMADGKYSAAVAALIVKTKLAGLWVDKAENKANNVVYYIADKPMTMDEWAQKWCSAGQNVSN